MLANFLFKIYRVFKRVHKDKKKSIETHLQVGKHSYGGYKIWRWNDIGKLTIGNFCSIGQNVNILLGGNHRGDWGSTFPFPAYPERWTNAKGIEDFSISKGNVTIGHDVWIGNDAVILSGVTIGNGAIIGCNTVVTKDVDQYAVVVGNPGRLIKYRFSKAIIAELSEVSWWDWDDEKINRFVPLLCQPDIEIFLKAAITDVEE